MKSNHNSKFLETAVCELDRMAVEEAIKRRCYNPTPSALVLPGRCELTVELARKGVLVTASDVGEWDSEGTQRQLPESVQDNVRFLSIEPGEIRNDLPHQPFDIAIWRRGLCALTYASAREAVKQLLHSLKIGGRLYLSVYGLHSELGHHYAGVDVDINQRFCELSPKVAEKYGVHGEVCLYTERNLFSLILEAGGSVLRTFTTTHGSIKGIAVRM